jgi:hypothetical protein
MDKSALKIFHISDIHFNESYDRGEENYRHSLPCMSEIERVFGDELPDILAVTGDLTNLGDPLSLDRVHQWLRDRINVSARYYGLNAKDIPLVVVPGNHDAFNASTAGSNLRRWQSSLENYHKAFPEAFLRFNGVDYHWFEQGDLKLFICCVDSCYLGDTDSGFRPNALSFNRVAMGKLSGKQSEELVKLYDKGIRGELRDRRGVAISAAAFLSSFKLMAIHHYVFEPKDAKPTPTLQMSHKRVVFQNIAMADFDALICGHKHFADHATMRYLDHFEPRGRLRYAFNHVRRVLGLESLPLDETQTEGRSLGHHLRVFLSALYFSRTKDRGLTPDIEKGILDCLTRCLSDRTVMKTELVTYLIRMRRGDSRFMWEEQEMLKLYHIIRQNFSVGQVQELTEAARSLRAVINKLAKRQFIHVAAGSAAKLSEIGKRQRSFNVYTIAADNVAESHTFKTVRYSWEQGEKSPDGDKGRFIPTVLEDVVMPYSRVRA